MDYCDFDSCDTDPTLLELLDRVLNTGVVLAGEIVITVADIELICLHLQLMLTSAETARQAGWLRPCVPNWHVQHGAATGVPNFGNDRP